MAPTSENSTATKPLLSPREVENLIAAVLSVENFKPDMEKFLKYSGYASANSAAVRWSELKKKIAPMAGEDGLVAVTPTPRKRKAKAAAKTAEDEDHSTPTKKFSSATKKASLSEAKGEQREDSAED